MLKAAVAKAIEEIKAQYPDHAVLVREDRGGGAVVIVEGLDPGPIYKQRETWVGFRIGFQYPNADVYPHFVGADLQRADGKVHGGGISSGHTFENRPALQLSRRSKRLDPTRDTAALKLLKVLHWLESQP